MDFPRRLAPRDPALSEVLELIRANFSYMDGVIDPPSSMHHLTVESLSNTARSGEVWSIGAPPVACVVLTPMEHALYIGKLAVDPAHRKAGHARTLITLAEARARDLGLSMLELQVRVELVANQTTFARMGFVESGRTAHKGYDRPTSITYQKSVKPLN